MVQLKTYYLRHLLETLSFIKKGESTFLYRPEDSHSKDSASLQETRIGYELIFNSLILSSADLDVGKGDSKFILEIHSFQFEVSTWFISERSTNFKKNEKGQVTQTAKAIISSFQSKDFSESTQFFYKLLIPLSKEVKFHFCIEEVLINTDVKGHSRNATKVEFKTSSIVTTVIKDNSNTPYLVLISDQCQTLSSFSDQAFAVINALGYLTGHMAGNHAYFFAYSEVSVLEWKHLIYRSIRPELRSIYQPVYTNSYGYLSHLPKEADYYFNHVRLEPVSQLQLSEFCKILKASEEFTSVIHLILEANSASLVFRPGGYAIALETLANLIKPPIKQKLNPIKTKPAWHHIRLAALKALEEVSDKLDPSAIKLLMSRINDLNKPTNNARLYVPFEYLGIELSEKEKEVLNHRDDLLHGRVPDITKAGSHRSLSRLNADLLYTSLRFYDLLAMLILKRISYESYLLNHVKLEENSCDISTKEAPYRKI